jgi:hypothetical protein
MDINYKFLENNGFLDQKDYTKLTKEWLSLLNPLRVPKIRKFLKFTNLTYDVYKEEVKKISNSYTSVEDEIDMFSIPLFFVTTFSSTLFPEFQDEYFAPLSFLTNKNYISLKGLKIIEPSLYHSLTKTQYDLELLIKERFEASPKFKDISEEAVVLSQFLLPFDIDSEFPMTIVLNVNMLVK